MLLFTLYTAIVQFLYELGLKTVGSSTSGLDPVGHAVLGRCSGFWISLFDEFLQQPLLGVGRSNWGRSSIRAETWRIGCEHTDDSKELADLVSDTPSASRARW
ncbi:MAG: hypothetical protein U0872_12105 [Planctomycetaceae bacterium]